MNQNNMFNFNQNYKELQEDLGFLRQNRLLGESSFFRFASDRSISLLGVGLGDPGDFHRRNWISIEGKDHRGGPLFHPFRIYPLLKILEACKLNISTSSTLNRSSVLSLVKVALSMMFSIEKIGELARQWDQIVDLAILLEPIYWPRITGFFSNSGGILKKDFDALLESYRPKALQLVGSLNLNSWRKVHESLRHDAAILDDNGSLYLMLRLSNWRQRENLKGTIAGALWFRHIAEVIRRAFEEKFSEQWPEEDEAFGTWRQGNRTLLYGSERPLDNESKSKPYLALHYGLFTGSAVRWYVEGETEFFAILNQTIGLSKVVFKNHKI